MKKVVFSTCLAIILFASCIIQNAEAKAYLRPIVGYAIPVNGGDGAYTVGAALGYTILEAIALELSYTRYFGANTAPDANLYELSGTYSIYFPVISPFFKVGAGVHKISAPGTSYNGLAEVGLGATLTILPAIDVGGGFSFVALFDAPDYVYPYFYLGLSF
jgi:hypothetical protein